MKRRSNTACHCTLNDWITLSFRVVVVVEKTRKFPVLTHLPKNNNSLVNFCRISLRTSIHPSFDMMDGNLKCNVGKGSTIDKRKRHRFTQESRISSNWFLLRASVFLRSSSAFPLLHHSTHRAHYLSFNEMNFAPFIILSTVHIHLTMVS